MSHELVGVWSGTASEAGIVAAFLEGNGIEVFLINAHMGTVAPHHFGGSGGGVGIAVRAAEAEAAAAALAGRGDASEGAG